jgi:uncharacterized protein YdhG (YjbR/CyaY superfamily)
MATKRKTNAKPQTIDEYLAALDADKRAALEKLRRIIRTAVPEAEECISYQLPAFRLDGRVFIWIGAAAKHCAIYGEVGALDGELAKYATSKGKIRFPADKPLPVALVKRVVKARIARNAAKRPRSSAASRRRSRA